MNNETNHLSISTILTSWYKTNKKLLLITTLFFLLLILLLISSLYVPKKTMPYPIKPSPNPEKQDTTLNNNVKLKTQNAPKVFFESYTNRSSFVNTSGNLKTYSLKTNFTSEEILSFAKKFGVETIRPSNDSNIIIYNLSDKNKKGIMSFDKQTGSFSYYSYGELYPVSYVQNQSAATEVKLFLKEIGLDETIVCTNTYQRKDTYPDTIFLECHRDWSKIGLPIVNLGGVLNIKEQRKISDLGVGKLDDFTPRDDSVFNVSNIDINGNVRTENNANGKARPNDFNTITIGIAKDGRILSVVSNLRWIDKETTINFNDLISQKDALSLFENHKEEYSLTIPAGAGLVDFNKVYAGNIASAKNAVINDISLVFLEKMMDAPQDKYEPYFLIRGTAFLNSGYTVKFVQVVSALKSKLSLNPITQNVAGAKTYIAKSQSDKLQLGTFTPVPSQFIRNPTSTPNPTVEPEGPQLPSECSDLDGINVKLVIPGYGTLIVAASSFEQGYHTFFFKSSSNPTQDKETLKNMFFKSVEDQYVINMAKWLKEQTVAPAFNTVDDLYKIFRKIDVPFDIPNNPRSSHCMILVAKYEAPIPPSCSSVEANGLIDIVRAHKIAENVANRILQLRSENKLLDEANKENIFSDKTLRGFFMIFNEVPWDQTGLPEHGKTAKCYITGGSPTLYFYSSNLLNVSIKTNSPVSYSDPSIAGDVWNIISYPNGNVEQNGSFRSGLYYEYDKNKVRFDEPKSGFVIKAADWKNFIKNNLAKKFALNQKETESLISEVNNALFGKKETQYLKISLIDKIELDNKLPIAINPKPNNFYRINLFVKPLEKSENISEQLINPIEREGFTVVELGAYVEYD